MTSSQKSESFSSKLKYFGVAGLSGICATLITHPIDTIKVRCQVVNEDFGRQGQRHLVNPIKVVGDMWRQDRIFAFYNGIDSSILKQLTYQTARLGIYKYLYDTGIRTKGEVPFHKKLQYALIAATCGAIVGNPADMTMVRR